MSGPRHQALLLEPEFYGEDSIELLQQASIRAVRRHCADQAELVNALERAHANGDPFNILFVRLGLAIDTRVFVAGKGKLQWIVTPTTGSDHIDLTAASAHNIEVLSLKGELDFLKNITSTAELAWGLVLTLMRRIPHSHADVIKGNWRRENFKGKELRGKKLGILGLGRLGTIVAGYGKAFGMQVLGFDNNAERFQTAENRHVTPCELEELLQASDILTLHLPLDPSTQQILNARRIGLLKEGACVVNTARGELMDESALLRSLETGRIAACGLDVLCHDSVWSNGIPEDHPLIAYARNSDNLIITPHMGGYTQEAITRTRAFVVKLLCQRILK